MKKRIYSVVSFFVVSLIVCSCATTSVKGSNLKGKSAKVNTSKRTIVDYQGATLGKAIPEWVELLVEGQYSQSVLAKAMPNLENKKVFVTIGRGNNLDFVKTWTDLVDIETEVASTLERVAGKVVDVSMNGTENSIGNSSKSADVEKSISMYTQALSTVRFSGLERTASYWIQTQVTNKKEIIDEYYEYYCVWTMDEKLFNKQLESALTQIDETTTEANELKELVRQKLKDTLGISNNTEVTNQSDSYSLNY